MIISLIVVIISQRILNNQVVNLKIYDLSLLDFIKVGKKSTWGLQSLFLQLHMSLYYLRVRS